VFFAVAAPVPSRYADFSHTGAVSNPQVESELPVRLPPSGRLPLASRAVTDEAQDEGIRDRLSRQGEEALGRLAEELAGNPVVTAALSRAFEAREKAVKAQEATMGALGIPSAADIERLTRRLRSVSQRLEGIEDAVDRLDGRLAGIETRLQNATAAAEGAEVEGLGGRLDEIARDMAALREALAPGAEPPPRAQERLTVTE
jgi:hypothetical protein